MTRTAFLLLAMALVTPGCKEQPKKAEPKNEVEPKAEAPKPEPPKVKPGKGTLCTKLDGDACADPTESYKFGDGMAEINVVYTAPEVPKNAKNANILWIAEDVGEAAPKDYKIAAADAKLKGLEQKNATHITVKGKLTRPNKGWPVGRYRVEVRIEGQLVYTKQFEIEKAAP
jgi:hypothetical protein